MSQSHIPSDCYSVKSAAEKLGITPDNLLKKMRWRGWLYKGIFRRDPLKDMPIPQAIENGFLKKVKRNTPTPYDWDIAITKAGMNELGAKVKNISDMNNPKPAALTQENAHLAQTSKPTAAALEEREKCLRELEAMGIPVRKAS